MRKTRPPAGPLTRVTRGTRARCWMPFFNRRPSSAWPWRRPRFSGHTGAQSSRTVSPIRFQPQNPRRAEILAIDIVRPSQLIADHPDIMPDIAAGVTAIRNQGGPRRVVDGPATSPTAPPTGPAVRGRPDATQPGRWPDIRDDAWVSPLRPAEQGQERPRWWRASRWPTFSRPYSGLRWSPPRSGAMVRPPRQCRADFMSGVGADSPQRVRGIRTVSRYAWGQTDRIKRRA